MCSQRILIFGNLGYIGPVLVHELRSSGNCDQVIGYDTGYFERNYSNLNELAHSQVDLQYYGDVRRFDERILSGVDACIYLAAISNDPMGSEFAQPTSEINNESAVKIANAAKKSGVRNFVFASSCSVYGAGGLGARTEDDKVDPLTDYARSKIDTESGLAELADEHFGVTSLRFATACGSSPRLRLDLVLNDFVASALHERKITILSDGKPFRPLIDVRDMAKAMIWATKRTAGDADCSLVLNTGSDEWNFSVLDLAQSVADFYGDVEIDINTNAAPDNRSYMVDFSRLRSLAPSVYPKRSLQDTIQSLNQSISSGDIDLQDFRAGSLIRLNSLREKIELKFLDRSLTWR